MAVGSESGDASGEADGAGTGGRPSPPPPGAATLVVPPLGPTASKRPPPELELGIKVAAEYEQSGEPTSSPLSSSGAGGIRTHLFRGTDGKHIGSLGSLLRRWKALWWGLPSVCQALVVVALVNAAVMIGYAISAPLWGGVDEEIHISVNIVVFSLFILYSVVDAIIYENAMELGAAALLGIVVLMRLVWFFCQSVGAEAFKILWGVLMGSCQTSFLAFAALSYRQFGWRLLSKLGVDHRRQGSELRWRMVMWRNAYSTVVKLSLMMLFVLVTLGIDVAVEKQSSVDFAILFISIGGLFVGGPLAIFGALIASHPHLRKYLMLFTCTLPLALAQPIATIILYDISRFDAANARISVNVAFVMMFYVEDLVCNEAELTMTMSFVSLDPDLTLKFRDLATYQAWQRGFDHALLVLMSPSMPRARVSGDPAGASASPGSTSGRRLPSPRPAAGGGGAVKAATPERSLSSAGMPRRRASSGAFFQRVTSRKLLRTFGVTVCERDAAGTARCLPSLPDGSLSTPRDGALPPLLPPAEEGSKRQQDLQQRLAAYLATAAGIDGAGPSLWAQLAPAAWLPGAGAPAPPEMVSVGVQTDESELQSSWRGQQQQQQTEQRQQQRQQQQPAAGDADAALAASYAAAMVAAAGGQGQPPPPAATQPAAPGPSDDPTAALAASYFAAMSAGMSATPVAIDAGSLGPLATPGANGDADAAAGYLSGGDAPAPSTAPTTGDEALAISYATAVAAAAAGAGAAPAGSWQPQAPPTIPAGEAGPGPGPGRLLALGIDVVDYDDLRFGKLLGEGSEGAVYAAWFLESPVAVKRFNRVEDSLHEVGMYLGAGSHDNVVALRALCQHEGNMYLIMEYCPRGTLDVLLHHAARKPWDPLRLLPIVRSIARGVYHLHTRHILHRDLKPANIFVGHGQQMKIGDLGMARFTSLPSGGGGGGPPQLSRLTPNTFGTMQYAAPELINARLQPQAQPDLEWALKLDVWSFGVTLWEVLERKRPFDGMTPTNVQALWLTSAYETRLPAARVPEALAPQGRRIFRGLADLVQDCTRLDPLSRPSFADILQRLKLLGAVTASGRMAPSAPTGNHEEHLTEMEWARLRRIEENNRKMAELGVAQARAELEAASAGEQPAPRRRVVRQPSVRVPLELQRRSSRYGRTAPTANTHASCNYLELPKGLLPPGTTAQTACPPRFSATADHSMVALARPLKGVRVLHALARGDAMGRARRGAERSGTNYRGGWHAGKGMASTLACERALEAAQALVDSLESPAFIKELTYSMVASGFWCTAPNGLSQAIPHKGKSTLTAYLPEGQAPPENAVYVNANGNGWDIVFNPHSGGNFGFSGNWMGFSKDMRRAAPLALPRPADAFFPRFLPALSSRAAPTRTCTPAMWWSVFFFNDTATTEINTTFSLIFHVFRAFDYEDEEIRAARAAAFAAGGSAGPAAAAGVLDLSEEPEGSQGEEEEGEEEGREQAVEAEGQVEEEAGQEGEQEENEDEEEQRQPKRRRVEAAGAGARAGRRSRAAAGAPAAGEVAAQPGARSRSKAGAGKPGGKQQQKKKTGSAGKEAGGKRPRGEAPAGTGRAGGAPRQGKRRAEAQAQEGAEPQQVEPEEEQAEEEEAPHADALKQHQQEAIHPRKSERLAQTSVASVQVERDGWAKPVCLYDRVRGSDGQVYRVYSRHLITHPCPARPLVPPPFVPPPPSVPEDDAFKPSTKDRRLASWIFKQFGEEDEFTVDCLVAERLDEGGECQFLIKYKEFELEPEEASWMEREGLGGAQLALRQWEEHGRAAAAQQLEMLLREAGLD
eukprot:scaffold4.g4986.t1